MIVSEAVAAVLGGYPLLGTDVHSDFDLATAAMEGIPAAAAYRAVETGVLDAEEFYSLVVPRRTFERRRDENEPLTVVESDRLLRVIRIAVYAADVLGTESKARAWLRASNRSLRGKAPIALLETDVGARLVERALGRIEHGVYS